MGDLANKAEDFGQGEQFRASDWSASLELETDRSYANV